MPQRRILDCCLLSIGWCKAFIDFYGENNNSLRILFIHCRDRIRTTNNMLGDCYTVAVIQTISREELKVTRDPAEDLSQSPSYSTVLVK